MQLYTVRRLGQPRSTETNSDEQIGAESHYDAAKLSAHNVAGADLIVSNGPTSLRYHVDALGRLIEQSIYTGIGGELTNPWH